MMQGRMPKDEERQMEEENNPMKALSKREMVFVDAFDEISAKRAQMDPNGTERRRVRGAFTRGLALVLSLLLIRVVLAGLWIKRTIGTGVLPEAVSKEESNASADRPNPPVPHDEAAPLSSCQQELPLVPPSDAALDRVFATYYNLANTSFTQTVAEKLSGMVRIKTVSFDDMKGQPVEEPLPDDPRRLGLYELRSYLKSTWPTVHSKLSLDIINRYGLVYTWKGTDSSLKPVMFAAHQDTVPVPADTLSRWTYPPFEGVIADGRIWGRGSSDCKAQVTAILEAAENLAVNGFQPRRTIIFAFGFDEEISGTQGAATIAKHIESLYGTNGVEFVLDEGTGLEEAFGATFAYLATSEKGYLNVQFSVSTPGGHSSVPPEHTGIGILAELIVHMEAHPFPLSLGTDSNESPLLGELRCAASHGPSMDDDLRAAILKVDSTTGAKKRIAKRALANRLAKYPVYKAVISTTQAVDIISGGVKVNALPELATTLVNYRIAADSGVAETEERLFRLSKFVAKKFNMTLTQVTSTGEERNLQPIASGAPSYGAIHLQSEKEAMNPSPRTPVDGAPFKIVAGTALHALRRNDEKLIVSPSSPTGNTDTRYYHGLSPHILRFSPLRSRASRGVHTVDENAIAIDVVASSGFFYELMRNVNHGF
ncbi:carboxypeptidase S [Zopfochytrium polystomum]|nr:carboxypeptidase S [Zopfochytrium polystomum]